LDSVLAQTFTDWEAICVDDGSTDESGAILDEYAVKDKRFRVIHQVNAGVSAARNAGMDAAKGEWLYFVDGDDAIHSGALKIYNDLIGLYPLVDCFFFPGFLEFEKVHLSNDVLKIKSVHQIFEQPRNGRELFGTEGIHGYTQLRLFRRLKFLNSKYPLGVRMMEDALQVVRMFTVSAVWALADVRVYGYRSRSDSASNHCSQSCGVEVMRVYREIIDIAINKIGCTRLEIKRFADRSKGVFQYYLLHAIKGADRELIKTGVSIALEIEDISRVNFIDFGFRLKACVAKKFGCYSFVYKFISCFVWLYLGVKSRVYRLFRIFHSE
jgi:glycosyltransferase involved in cell wall biosynthesis